VKINGTLQFIAVEVRLATRTILWSIQAENYHSFECMPVFF